MDWGTSQYLQLIIGLALGVVLFVGTYAAPQRVVLFVVLLLIPFQPISSLYGNLNDVLVYMVAVSFLLQRRIKYYPLFGAVAMILFAYLLSMSQTSLAHKYQHVAFIIAIIANFLVFYLVYNFIVRDSDGFKVVWRVLAVMNILVIGYCTLQALGGERVTFLGAKEFAFNRVVGYGSRLTGPFQATAMMAEYLSIQILLYGYALMHETRRRNAMFYLALIITNCIFLIMTGNRGGIITLVIGALLFLFVFRRELGAARIGASLVAGIAMLVVVSVIVTQYTQFNVLFERLGETEFEGVVPDTRVGWFEIWDDITANPILGHGPRFWVVDNSIRHVPFPHNLFMFIIYSVGSVGLLAYLYFFGRLVGRFWKGMRSAERRGLMEGLPALGLIIMVMFAVSELRMEFLRYSLHDYQQYIFLVLAMFLATSDIVIAEKRQQSRAEPNHNGRG